MNSLRDEQQFANRSNPIVAIRFNDETKMRVTVDEWIKKIIQMTQMKGFRVEDRDFTAEDIEKLSFAKPELITKFTIYAYGDSVVSWSIESNRRNHYELA